MEEWKFEPAHDIGLKFSDRLRSLRRESGLVETLVHVAWWSFIRLYLSFFHRLSVRGKEHLPRQAPFIMVANHASHLDVLALASIFPWRLRDRVFPIAAGDTFFEGIPIAVFAAYALNALPLWRKNCDPRDLQDLRRRLVEEPCTYVLFPEGTRSRTGALSRFRRGIGSLVAGTDVPVVPCYLRGTFEAFPANRNFPLPKPVSLKIGPPLRFPAVRNDAEGWTEVAGRLEDEVRQLGEAD